MTIIPSFLISGIFTLIFGGLVALWTFKYIQIKNGGLILVLLSIIMLLVGGGLIPPIIAIIAGILGTQIKSTK